MENNQTLSRTVPAGNIKPPLELHIFVQASVYDEDKCVLSSDTIGGENVARRGFKSFIKHKILQGAPSSYWGQIMAHHLKLKDPYYPYHMFCLISFYSVCFCWNADKLVNVH